MGATTTRAFVRKKKQFCWCWCPSTPHGVSNEAFQTVGGRLHRARLAESRKARADLRRRRARAAWCGQSAQGFRLPPQKFWLAFGATRATQQQAQQHRQQAQHWQQEAAVEVLAVREAFSWLAMAYYTLRFALRWTEGQEHSSLMRKRLA